MGKSYRQIIDEVARHIQDTSSGRELRIKDAIGRQYEELAANHDWSDLYRLHLSEVITYAGESVVFLPRYIDIGKSYVVDSNKDLLFNMNPEMFFNRFKDTLGTNANMFAFTNNGSSPIKRPMDTPEQMTFVSSDASDTSPVIEVWGLVGPDEINESITLSGTTPVTTSNTFDRITKLSTASTSLDSSRLGIITVTGATSLTEFATIPPQYYDSKYQSLYMKDAPNSQDTLSIVYKKKIAPLVNDGDTLEIPADHALFEFAVMDILDSQGKSNQAREHERKGTRYMINSLSRYGIQAQSVQQSFPIGPGTGSYRDYGQFGLFGRRISVVGGNC